MDGGNKYSVELSGEIAAVEMCAVSFQQSASAGSLRGQGNRDELS